MNWKTKLGSGDHKVCEAPGFSRRIKEMLPYSRGSGRSRGIYGIYLQEPGLSGRM